MKGVTTVNESMQPRRACTCEAAHAKDGRMVRLAAWLGAVVCACVLAGALAGCAGQGGSSSAQESSSPVAATFGDHVITQAEVDDYTHLYRMRNGFESDQDWQGYLESQSADSATWREEAIRVLAQRILVQEKAADLGIQVDEAAVDAAIDEAMEQAGCANDAQAWERYLEQRQTTSDQLRADYAYTSIEQQLLTHEIDFSTDVDDAMCDAYIQAYLADQVVRRYSALVYESGERELAQADLDALLATPESERPQAFERLLAQRPASDGASDAEGGDLGWDFYYDEARIDPDRAVRKAKLDVNGVFDALVESDGLLYVLMCTDRVDFSTTSYAHIGSEHLQSVLARLALRANWASICTRYLDDLVDQADVQVTMTAEQRAQSSTP